METLELKDIKPVPDAYHTYTKAIQDAATPIVIDNGSYNCRAGWASNENPMMVLKNLIAKPRKERGKKDGETQIGNDIANIEAVRFQLKMQFDRNVVVHYETQEQIFDHIFSHLGIDTEGRVNHPIVLTEPYLNPNYSRTLMSELLFECYQVPGVCYGVDALFSFFRRHPDDSATGLIVDCGYHCTHVLPVLDGRVDAAHARRLNIGGYHMTGYLHRLLQLKYPAHFASITLSRAEELLHEHCYLAAAAEHNYCDEVWQWADCDYYETHVVRVQLPYQTAAAMQGAGDDQQRQRRQELKRRLLEINARKREEKLAEDEEHLNQLLAVQDVEEEGDEAELERSLALFNLQNTDELRKAIKDVQQRIEKTRQRIVAANTADDTAIEEAKPKLTKSGLVAPKEEGDSLVEWVADLRKRRQQLMERRTARKQRLADMAKRRTVAAQERMRLISQLAGGGGGSGGGEGSGKRAKDDDFGARDEDWDVYKAINKEGGDTDSEEETEKLLELEEALRVHDPMWHQQSSGSGSAEVAPTSKEAHQLHVAIERLRATEILFQPYLVGCGQAGLAETIEYVFNGYDAATAARLGGNVFVTGGCARIPGLEGRLNKELREMRPFKSHFKVVMEAGDEASLGAWKGARQFALRDDFRKRFMTTRQDYAERGADYWREHRASNVYVATPVANQVTASDATSGHEMSTDQ